MGVSQYSTVVSILFQPNYKPFFVSICAYVLSNWTDDNNLSSKDVLEKIQLIYLSKKRMSSFWKREWTVIISQLDITLILQIVKAWFEQEVTFFPELVQKAWSTAIDLNSKWINNAIILDEYDVNKVF